MIGKTKMIGAMTTMVPIPVKNAKYGLRNGAGRAVE